MASLTIWYFASGLRYPQLIDKEKKVVIDDFLPQWLNLFPIFISFKNVTFPSHLIGMLLFNKFHLLVAN